MLGNKKLMCGILLAIPVFCAEATNLKTEHFQVSAENLDKKIIVRHGDLVSPEIDCRNIYQSRIREVNKNELLVASVIGHGTGFHIEKLFIIRAEGAKLRIYTISSDEILKQLRKRTKFEIEKNNLKIIIDNKTFSKKIDIDTQCYIDYCEEYFHFNLDNKLNITVEICKKGKDKAIYPDFVGDITFDISYTIKNGKLEFHLKKSALKI